MDGNYFQEAFGAFKPHQDQDAAVKFVLNAVLAERRFFSCGWFEQFLRDFIVHETKHIRMITGDPGWLIEYKGQEIIEDRVWPEGVDFCASVEPEGYELAYPEFFMTKDEFYGYVKKAIQAFIARHPDETALVEPVLALMNCDLSELTLAPDKVHNVGKLFGTHNIDNARFSLGMLNANAVFESTKTPGISELKYNYMDQNSKLIESVKTVYDPRVYSDQEMVGMVQRAGTLHWEQYLKNLSLLECDTTVNGVNFRSYINFNILGNPVIGNVHPINIKRNEGCYYQEAFDGFVMWKDMDAAVRFAINCILMNTDFDRLAIVLSPEHELSGIGDGDADWKIIRRDSRGKNDDWPDWADFQVETNLLIYGCPEIYLAKEDFYAYLKKGFRAFIARHPDKIDLIKPLLTLMNCDLSELER